MVISNNTQLIYYNPTAQNSCLSGGWTTFIDAEEEKDLEITRKYAKVLEIRNKVIKIIRYAKKHKLDIHDTLESFFDKNDIELYENVDKLKVMVDNIKARKKQEKKLGKINNLVITPQQSTSTTIG